MTTTKKRAAKAAINPPAENITNDDTRVITESMIGIGDNHPQGDIYFVRLSAMPASARPRKDRQLADGNTQGSRHVCVVGDVFDVDDADVSRLISAASKCDVGRQYVGPIVRTTGGRALIEHPEHGDHDYRGEMVLATVFQRSLDAEEQERRVQD